MTKDELIQKQKTIFQDPFSEEIWANTYKYHTDKTIDDTMYRVASAIASAEETPEQKEYWTEQFYDMLTDFKSTAGGRIYANAGTENKGTTLINCYVAPREKYDIDSLDNIMLNLKNQSLTLKSEGGWGENFSYIRPRGSFINGIGVESPGAIRFMEIFDKSSEIVTAGSGQKSKNKKAKGKIRKGAMMGVLDCLSGNTLIDTINGKQFLKDLVGTRPYLYSSDGKGNIFVRQAELVWSKGIKKTVRVWFDSGDFIDCTPEHKFMLSDGTYKQANELIFGESITALTRTLNGNYLNIAVTGSRNSIALHNAVFEMVHGYYPTTLGKPRTANLTVAHHIDFNEINNNPENLLEMSVSEHTILHNNANGILASHRERIANERRGKTQAEYYGEERAKEINKKHKETCATKKRIAWNKGLSGDNYTKHYEDGFKNQFTNHKFLKIEELGIEEEVYDIAMPAPYHNFCANGVFVHNCNHPDIIEFITAKQQSGRLSKFNISVNISDEFMSRLIRILEIDKLNDKNLTEKREQLNKWDLIFPDTTFEKYKEEWDGDIKGWKAKGYPVIVHDTVSLVGLWNLIMDSTYNRAEPGVLFLDRANFFQPFNYGEKEKVMATNPCGEQLLSAGGCCNLGSVNLTQFINEDSTDFDYNKIQYYVKILVRFLDNVNDVSNAPLAEYEYSMKNKRRIGVGILGWGSALYMLKTRFASHDANAIRDKLMKLIAKTAYETSIDLAIEKGMFPLCIPRKHSEGVFVNSIGLSDDYMQKLVAFGIRNSSLLSIQPTGNTGILANVSSGGLEPVFMHEYVRTVIVGHLSPEMAPFTPKWYEDEWYETEVFKLAKEGDEEILKGTFEGVVYKIDRNRGLTKEVLCEDYGVRAMKKRNQWDSLADWAATAVAMSAEDHLSDLTGFARWVDSAISKTINVPYEYPFENFKNIYLDAYNTGYIKGVTTYRAGTMGTVLAAKDETHATNEDEEIILDHVHLPKTLPATMSTIRAENRKWYITTTLNNEQTRPQAIFVHTNSPEKGVTTEDAIERLTELARRKGIPEEHIALNIEKMVPDNNSTKISRMISLNLRHGVLVRNIISALDDVENVTCVSFLFQIKKFLASYIKNGEVVEGDICPECGSKLVFQEGCRTCINCSYSKCG